MTLGDPLVQRAETLLADEEERALVRQAEGERRTGGGARTVEVRVAGRSMREAM